MTRKEPELQIKTTLAKFAGFLKALALIGILIGGSVGYNKLTSSSEDVNTEVQCSIEIEKRLGEYNQRLVKVETRMDNTDVNILEIKSSLYRIETYLMGR